jgi:glycerate dehydrogenase
MRIVILDSYTTDAGRPQDWTGLHALGEVAAHPRTARSETVARCQGAELVITNKVVLDEAVFAQLAGLRYVGLCSTGTNAVDLAAARARGIAVTNVPGYSTESVAQLVFAMILHFTSAVARHSEAVKAGRWTAGPDFCFQLQPLVELAGKRLVVLGRGAIGQQVARIGGAFGMEVIAAAVPGSTTHGRVPLASALAQADVVTLHCPLSPSTANLVDASFLAALKPRALLINTSRGGVVCESDVVAALLSGRLGGFAADVLAQEPPPACHPLTDPLAPYADRVLITPHLAWMTDEARARLRHEVGENAAAFLRGERRNRVD